MRKANTMLSVRLDPALAAAPLPPLAKRRTRAARPSRQQRFRDYVRDKRHR